MNKSLLLLFVWLFACTTTHAQIITTVAGGNVTGPGDGGPALDCQLNAPSGIAFDGLGNLYIADRYWHRVRRVDPSGIITTIAGTGVGGYSGDGGPATAAQLWEPFGIAIDAANNIYISEIRNARIRKITPAGTISTYVGTGVAGYSGDGGPATASQISAPCYIFLDNKGNLYIPEFGNNTVRRVGVTGIITTIAGTGVAGFSGDGGLATDAQLRAPAGGGVDKFGYVYISDCFNSRIRRIDRFGIITTIAGTGTPSYNGDGVMATAAQIATPYSIVIDNARNVYFGDTENNRVRKIDVTGKISTIAGEGSNFYGGDGGLAIAAQFITITGLTFDASDNLYIADMGSGRVRKVTAVTSVTDWELPAHHSITVYPNPSNGTFTINAPTQATIPIRITDCLGREVYRQSIQSGFSILLQGHLPGGVYVVAGMVNGTPFAQQLSIVR